MNTMNIVAFFSMLLLLLSIVSLAVAEFQASSHHSDENNDGLDDRYDLNRDGKPDDKHAVELGQGHAVELGQGHGHNNYNNHQVQGYSNGAHGHATAAVSIYDNHQGYGYNRFPHHRPSYGGHQNYGYVGKEHDAYSYHGLREPVRYGPDHGHDLKEAHGGLGYNLGAVSSHHGSHGYGRFEAGHGVYGMGHHGQREHLGYRSAFGYGLGGQGYGYPHQFRARYQTGPYEYEPYHF